MNESTGILRWSDLDPAHPLPGISAVVGTGKRLSAAMFHLAPEAVVPEHSHDNEEFGQVIRGSLELTWGEETAVLVAGEAFLLPAGVVHRARAGADGCELLECYAPPRNPVPANRSDQS